MAQQVELVLDARALLGEGPSWHEGEQKLYWVDLEGQTLHCYDPATAQDQTWGLPEKIGCVVPRKAGGLVISVESGLAFFEPRTGTQTLMCVPAAWRAETLPNDGKCDPAGRFWAGTKDAHEREPRGRLYCLHPDLTCQPMETQITVSNGITWNPAYTVMYYIDSPTLQVWAYDFDAAAGTIANRRVVIRVPPAMGFPDGMTSDREGMLWIAHWGGWQVTRWEPRTGKLLAAYAVPARHTSSCCFGGADLRDLYITSARVRVPADDLPHYPQAGGLFRLRTDVPGLETFYFEG